MQWYIKALKNYRGFTGRATRTEYWMFFLFNIIFFIALAFLQEMLGMIHLLTPLYSLAMFLPALAVLLRRLHDSGKSGWWVLSCLIPMVGFVILTVFACLPSEGNNKYGSNFNY
ncbi:DUF805 domain-containing protein [Paenibacillus sp. P46E]|uniref:DUF805 domain-containing protein n=1 Tax=Paenibacillus sp. P46E TaxID=1349436 RepID=UPI000938EBBD|nr:DUF805 domain-containing protein [Paenibacillus sp. P46E]OKP99781.1 hypothetical protein A3849_02965 [Paenibacillus sp. P46E]